MKTRRILGTDIQSALREVRRSLGPDAVIMTTRETAQGIEIVAGIAAPSQPTAIAVPPAAAASAAPRAGTGALSSLAAGLARPGVPSRPSSPVAGGASIGRELEALGLSPELRARVLDDVHREDCERTWDEALAALASRIPVQGNAMLRHGGRIAVVGGTGVGKTTTVAKLAAHFARLHGPRSVALVNADTFRVGASEQLRRYARLMGLAVCGVRSLSDLGRALERLADRKLVLIDTGGASYHDMQLMRQLELLRSAGTDVSCYLAASFNTQLAVLDRTVRAFQRLELGGCILTKSDEAVSLGPAISIAARYGLPVSFVTTGPSVPADIRIARSDWLVQRAVELLEEARREEGAGGNPNPAREVI